MKAGIRILVAGLMGLTAACTTPATDGTQKVAAANVGPNGEPLVCRNIPVTGTRFPQKECKTAEAWAEYDAYTNSNAKESTDRLQRLNTGCATQAEFGCSY